MPQKIVELEPIGQLTLRKSRQSRHLRISVSPHKGVIVSMPSWTPYAAGLAFARSKADWIIGQQSKLQTAEPISHDMRIGKAHRINLNVSYPAIRVGHSEITGPLNASQQQLAAAAERALRRQATALLPQRLSQLSKKTELDYKNLSIKKMHSRWGSCSNTGVITLNIFLMQLPWELIDYVIMHELVHTRHMNHSPEFWRYMEDLVPDVKQIKKILKTYPTQVTPRSF